MKASPSGHFSPLRYPGGKGKLARFVTEVVRENGLSDGTYVEPYAGGAAIAWELLLCGTVRRVCINDLNRPVFAFWNQVLSNTDQLLKRIADTDISMDSWRRCKLVCLDEANATEEDLAFAFFFLNRTNRSGILNAGAIGGKAQTGPWKLDARYNKSDLMKRIAAIGRLSSRVKLTQLDAVRFLKEKSGDWGPKTLVYLDPPYYVKGRDLYYNFYNHDDHANVAQAVHLLRHVKWLVSYDDVAPIHDLYEAEACLQYSIRYSARESAAGREAMFFSAGLSLPPTQGSMIELLRTEVPVAG